jgi:hypothetical protein
MANQTCGCLSALFDEMAEGAFGGRGEGGNLAQIEHETSTSTLMKMAHDGAELSEFRGPDLAAKGNRHFMIELMYLCVKTHN